MTNTDNMASFSDAPGAIGAFGRVKVIDLADNKVILDKSNAIHPQNLSRVFARALANESNSSVFRIALGNGGTVTTSSGIVSYKLPNDGINDNAGFSSRLYNETYSEVIDESSPLLGTGLGASPENDPASTIDVMSSSGVFSREVGEISQVVVNIVLNENEPYGQLPLDHDMEFENSEGDFTFDELALFTGGASPIDTNGYQDVDVGSKLDVSDTGLDIWAGSTLSFSMVVDGNTLSNIQVAIPPDGGTGPNGEYTYQDLCDAINQFLSGVGTVVAEINSDTTNTFGKLRFRSLSTGPESYVSIVDETTNPDGIPNNWLFSAMPHFVQFDPPVYGQEAGDINNPTDPDREVERMLTHLIFSPITKSANRAFKIVYILTITVLPSAHAGVQRTTSTPDV